VRAPPPSRADGGTLTHGELPLQPASGLSAMLRAQRRRETEGGWADMREELLAKVLELLEAAGWQQGGLGFSQTSATVRLVCAGWKAVHDALVRRLVLRRQTTDEAVGMMVRSFPAVVSLEVKGDGWSVFFGRGAASSDQPACVDVSQPHLLCCGDGRRGCEL
jgi:hypothetical protein